MQYNQAEALRFWAAACQPKRVGGFELPFGVQTSAGAEIAKFCGSSGWITSVLGTHHWMLGKFAFEAQDDIWSKNKLEEQIKFMQDQAISFCHTSYKIINEKGDFVSLRKARNFMTVNDLIKSCDIGLSTVLIEKEAIGLNKFPELKTKEDFVLWLQLLSKNVRIYGIDKELALWRKSNNSLSSSLFQKITDGYKVYNVYMKYNMVKSIYYLLCLSINFLKK